MPVKTKHSSDRPPEAGTVQRNLFGEKKETKIKVLMFLLALLDKEEKVASSFSLAS